MAELLNTGKHFGVQEQVVIVGQRSLDFPERYTFFGNLQSIDFVFKKVWVELKSVPPFIEYDKESIITIDFIGHSPKASGSCINNLHIESYKNPYNIIFNPQALIDCYDLSVEDVKISFTLNFQRSESDSIQAYEFVLNIKLTKAVPQAKCQFCFADGKPYIQYKNSIQLLGELRVVNDSVCKYAETLSIEETIKYDKAFENDIVFWGNLSEIEESAPYYDYLEGIRTPDQKLVSCLKKTIIDDKLTLRNIVAKNTISIPVYIDLMRIGNPTDDKLESSFTLDTFNLGNNKEDITKVHFYVSRDTQCTQMAVSVNGQNISNEQSLNIGKFKWVEYSNGDSHRFNGITRIINLQIFNLAENKSSAENAAVVIKNIHVAFDSDVDSITKIFNQEVKTINDQIELFNEPNSCYSLEFKLMHRDINALPNDIAHVKAFVDFDYFEDGNGERDEFTDFAHFSAIVNFIIETDPGNEWLCIDFGTSATVAAFGNGSESSNLLNLDQQAEAITSNVPQRMRNPRFEEGTPFLSSNAKFRQGGTFDDDAAYSNRFVWFSPTEPQFYSDSFILPYIKSLVGYNFLPSTLNYDGLRYQIKGQNKEFSVEPLSVDEIFTSIYRSLFKDFIMPSISANTKSVNKLILSVPNTYTPRHLDYLRSIVTKNIPQIRRNYIWFISESDAIASYYVTNWLDLNACREDDVREEISAPGTVEHILAFDMGAGTLDLTYFSITNNEDYTRSVNILAKIGLNKAGNYLDYIIAEALIDTHSELLPKSLLSPENDPTLFMMAGKLKHFIKQKIKPNLFKMSSINFSELKGEEVQVNGDKFTLGDVEINLLAIRQHKSIQNFIKECTAELIENLFVINGYSRQMTPIDTVIFTGRSVQFGDGQEEGIRQTLMNSIAEWNIKSNCQSINIEGKELKTIVCDGALHFATTYSNESSAIRILNRNIYASYGLLFKNIRGEFQYLELLSPKTKPTREPNLDAISTNGVYIYEYDTDKFDAQDMVNKKTFVDLRNSPIAFFVQSYSQDTARDWKRNKRELISVMWDVVSASTVTKENDLNKVPVRIEVNSENEMIFSIGNLTNEPSAPMVINIKESESFKKSMWPYM